MIRNVRLGLFRFGICLEIIKDALPAESLPFDRIFRFRVECLYDVDGFRFLDESDFDFPVIAQYIGDEFMWLHIGIGTTEIETQTAVFRFHPGSEPSARPQIVFRGGGMPIR